MLQTFGSGFAVAGLTGIVDANSDRTRTIVAVKKGDTPVKKEKVPYDWWEHVEHVKLIREELRSRYENNSAVAGFGIISGNETLGGKRKKIITARIKHDRDLRISIPDSVDRTPVIERTHYPIQEEDCHGSGPCDTEDDDPVPGGAYLTSGGSYFTSTCLVNYQGDPRLMTTSHTFIDGCGDNEFEFVNQGESENYVGFTDTDMQDYHRDFALITESDSSEIIRFADRVKTSRLSSEEVSGHITENGLLNREGSSNLTKHGARTCTEQGPLVEVYDGGRCSGTVNFIRTDPLCSGCGDSGAPYYEIWEDSEGCEWAATAGIHIGTPVGSLNTESIGCAAHEIADAYDIEFGPRFDSPCGPIQ